ETFDLPAGLIISCIGYRTLSIPGVPFDNERGRFENVDGEIASGLYCVGWARRGPTGTIGTNRPDGFLIAEKIAACGLTGERSGREGLEALLRQRDIWAVTFGDWKQIDAAEIARARIGAPREKFVRVGEMLGLLSPNSGER
ncbi:MAG TPA: pyridine nucleotide-disulfide oxidoreductase, partial [Pedomonas sp.]